MGQNGPKLTDLETFCDFFLWLVDAKQGPGTRDFTYKRGVFYAIYG
jgi:hypothetical protein